MSLLLQDSIRLERLRESIIHIVMLQDVALTSPLGVSPPCAVFTTRRRAMS